MHRNTATNLAVWAGLVLIVAMTSVITSFRTLTLCVGYQTTAGVISQKFPNNHHGINFSYKVAGRDYEGRGYVGQIGRSFDGIQLGDTVTVFYDERRPASSTLDVPRVLLVRTVGQILAACAIVPVLGMYVLVGIALLRPDLRL